MDSSAPLISVVIPAYNRRDSVLELLGDLARQQGVAFEVVVVDDHSPDDTAQVIPQRYPSVKFLRNDRNQGPAVSRNRGVRTARGAYIVGFDSDVRISDPQLLAKTAQTFQEHPEATGLAFRLLSADGKSEDRPRWWHPLPIEQHATRWFETDYFSGTGYAFRRQEMIAAGLYPEILYMHYEEVELAFRILDAGGAIYHAPHLTVIHQASPIANRGKIHKFYKPRNQILVAAACYPFWRAVGYLLPRIGYNLVTALRHGHLFETIMALSNGLRLSGQRLRERNALAARTWERISRMHRDNTHSSAA